MPETVTSLNPAAFKSPVTLLSSCFNAEVPGLFPLVGKICNSSNFKDLVSPPTFAAKSVSPESVLKVFEQRYRHQHRLFLKPCLLNAAAASPSFSAFLSGLSAPAPAIIADLTTPFPLACEVAKFIYGPIGVNAAPASTMAPQGPEQF